MIAIRASAAGALLDWKPTLAELGPPLANTLTRELDAWDAPPPLPYVWTPSALDWTVPATVRVGWSPLAFRWRYSAAEQVAIELAAWGTAGPYDDAQRALLRIIEKSLDQVQTQVYHDDPRTTFGVGKHVEFGLIAQQRATEILDPQWSPPWAPAD